MELKRSITIVLLVMVGMGNILVGCSGDDDPTRPGDPLTIEIDQRFDADVFLTGDWSRSNSSVIVDESNSWLRIGNGEGNGDYAEKLCTVSLPVVVECRMRLVSDGRNYTLPYIGIHYGETRDEADYITYLLNLNDSHWGWNFMDEWTDVHTLGPVAENQWLTVKAVLRVDGGELYAKQDSDMSFTQISTREWVVPSEITKIRFTQPWDSVCDYDYFLLWKGVD